jgi:hypothetical protein
MTNLVESSSDKELTLKAFSWAGYANMVTASVEQARRVMKFGGLSQPDVAEHLQSSRASLPGRADM